MICCDILLHKKSVNSYHVRKFRIMSENFVSCKVTPHNKNPLFEPIILYFDITVSHNISHAYLKDYTLLETCKYGNLYFKVVMLNNYLIDMIVQSLSQCILDQVLYDIKCVIKQCIT